MRRFMIMAVVLSAVLVGCGPAAVTDPYVLTSNAMSKPWDRVQVNVGLTFQSADTTVSVTPEMIRLILDTTSGKALFNLAVPAQALGISAAELAQAGLASGVLELDVLFDAQALYVRAPMMAGVLPMRLGVWDELPEGDFSGWLKLGTVADFEALMAMAEAMGGGMGSQAPDLSALEGLAPAELKSMLEGSGITLNFEGGETRNGVEVDHISILVDYDQFASNPPIDGFDTSMLDEMAASGLTMTTDIWFERASGRISEIHASGASNESELEAFEVTLTFTEPDASVSFDSPATFVDVPLFELLAGFMGGFTDGFGDPDDFGFDFDGDFDFGEDDFDFDY